MRGLEDPLLARVIQTEKAQLGTERICSYHGSDQRKEEEDDE
jgi:hypothetical protein